MTKPPEFPEPPRSREALETALTTAEQTAREIFNHLPDPAWIFEREGFGILAVNDAALRRYGWSREEFLRLSLPDLRPEAERGRLKALITNSPSYRQSFGEWKHMTKDGVVFPVDITAQDLVFQGRDCRIALARDASDRTMAWQALQETEATYRGLVENLSEGVAILNEESLFVFTNPACERIFRVAPGGLEGKGILDFIAPERQAENIHDITSRPKGETSIHETEILRPDGERRWISVRAAPRLDSSGGHSGTTASFFDITDQRLALEALAHSEARFRRLIELVPYGVVTYQDGRLLYANPAASAITRSDPAKTLGRPVIEFIHSKHWADIKARMERLIQGENVPPADMTFTRGDGSEVEVETQAIILEPGDRPVMISVFIDLTKRNQAEQGLRESEERYRALVEQAVDMIYLVDLDTRVIIQANQAFSQTLGYEGSRLTGLRLYDILDADPASVDRNIELVEASGHSNIGRRRMRNADGTLREVEVSASVLRAPGHRLMMVMARDIGDRLAAEREIQKFHAMAENSPNLVLMADLDGQLTYVNPAGRRLLGLDIERAKGRFTRDFITEGAWRQFQEVELPAILSEGFWEGESVALHSESNEAIPVHVSSFLVRHPETGEALCLATNMEDLRERRKSESELAASRAFTDIVLDSLPGVFYAFDQSGKMLRWNRKFEEVSGYSSDEVRRLTALDFISERDRDLVAQEIRRVFTEGQSRVDAGFHTQDGRDIPHFFTGSRIEFNGQMILVGMGLDISDRKRAEAALQQSQKLESLGVLAGGIAHDFNNLLTAMMGNLNLAQFKSHPSSPSWPYLDAMEKTLHRAADLTRQMLAYSGKGRFVTRVMDLNLTVEEMTHLLSVSISKKVRLHFDFAPNLPPLTADPAQLQQIVMNLVTNASDAIGENDGAIRVATGLTMLEAEDISRSFPTQTLQPGPHLLLEVSDTGSGMAPETLLRIFEPFFTTKMTGRGLGLSAMLGILRGHRAGILIDSVEGKGTTFRIYLPASSGATAQEPDPIATGGFTVDGAVLVVDDEPEIREIAVSLFQMLGFTTVLEASDGAEALDVYQAHHADIRMVFMDLTMPRMSGLEAFRALRAMAPGLSVVLTSGFNEEESLGEGETPAGFLQKPYRFLQLRNLVAQVLGKS